MRLGANIPSLLTQNSMSHALSRLTRSSQRLSSGLRINSAGDDPAGLAIANKIRLQVRGLERASQNASNGISMVQTAEGALNEVHNMLQRIRELSIAAATDTVEPDDRRKMQDEIDQLIMEINDIPRKTEFNRMRLLNGEADRILSSVQLNGANAGINDIEILRIGNGIPYGEIEFTVIEAESTATTATFTLAAITPPLFTPDLVPIPNPIPGQPPIMIPNTAELTLNGRSMIIQATDDQDAIEERLRSLAVQAGFDIDINSATGDVTLTARELGSRDVIFGSSNPALLESLGLTTTVGSVTTSNVTVTLGFDREMEVTAPPELVNADFTFEGDRVTVTMGNGQQIFFRIGENVVNGDTFSLVTRRGPLTMQVGPNKNTGLHMTIPRVNARTIGIDRANVATREGATGAILFSDNAIAVVSQIRSRLGAYQNRLEHTVASVDVAHTNAAHSLSRIVDTDMAHEMTEYSKYNVIYQAGIAILAQSNARPQSLLQLLQ